MQPRFVVCGADTSSQKKRGLERTVILETLEGLAEAMNREDNKDKPPEYAKREAAQAAQDQLVDMGNLERYCLWVITGGNERGLGWQEIGEMSADDVKDFQLLARLFAPLYRRERKKRENEKSKKNKNNF